MELLGKLDKAMEKIERNIVGYATVIFTAIMFINVVMRNVTRTGLVWSNELSSYLNILAVFFVISAGFKHGDHVGVDAFVRLLPEKLQDPMAIISNLISLFFCGMISYLASRLVVLQVGQASPVLSIPFSVLYGIMVVGMIFSCVRIILNIAKIIKRPEEPISGGDL